MDEIVFLFDVDNTTSASTRAPSRPYDTWRNGVRQSSFLAKRYVLVDDKLRILAAVKTIWGDRVTTVFPRQGHYANDPKALAGFPAADVSIERIGDLLTLDLSAFAPNGFPASC